ncbi:MAP kinase kinase (MEK) [Stygiomarasmius scandens]|uniref:MAP kinase kinase (MEK) n=1 Tax=Marasmiellus scandens TaxID=2682957 RepID=A0ABR1JJT3_9AGAR
MATPIRKKRNFKALQLQTPPTPPAEPEPERPPPAVPVEAPVATRQAPTAGGKKRPPPMTLKAPKVAPAPPVDAGDSNLLTVHQSTTSSAPNTASISPSARRNTYHATLSNTLATLEAGAEVKFDLRNEDLKDLHELGQGNGGSVKKVEHIPTGTLMAKKIVLIDAKPSVRKQILRELQIMHDCHSQYIISFYGAFLADPNICICMEFMDKGSLDGIYKKIGAIDIGIVGKVALAVLEGLTYLYDVHRIIHRDIKPSNILCNGRGEIKICDFGVSGELINSIADTFVGTSTYMSPERIQGAQYTVKSDVWSLGISLIELALGRFPFAESADSDSDLSDLGDYPDFNETLSPARPGSIGMSLAALSLGGSPAQSNPPSGLPPPRPKKSAKSPTSKKDKRKSKGVSLQGGGMTMSILELLQHIVNEPAPRLSPSNYWSARDGDGDEEGFPEEAESFVDSCLFKDPEQRKTPRELLNHPWILLAKRSEIDVESWASRIP